MRLGYVLCALALGFFADSLHAGVYGYTDAAGVVHLSNIAGEPGYETLIADPDEAPAAATVAEAPKEAAGIPRQQAKAKGSGKRQRFASLISDAARRQKVDAALLHAVIATESAYDPQAVSPKGAVGLMQVMPQTARLFTSDDIRDPVTNIEAGARYLRHLLDMFDQDLSLALAAYNAGHNAVLRYGRQIPPFPETQRYVPRVIQLYRALSR